MSEGRFFDFEKVVNGWRDGERGEELSGFSQSERGERDVSNHGNLTKGKNRERDRCQNRSSRGDFEKQLRYYPSGGRPAGCVPPSRENLIHGIHV